MTVKEKSAPRRLGATALASVETAVIVVGAAPIAIVIGVARLTWAVLALPYRIYRVIDLWARWDGDAAARKRKEDNAAYKLT